ncbi:MAG: TonB-dependent receptor [Bacteroidetes bacterium]|nr:MAG: TonB-dependent receptor [Bacteroidota bacterium]
MKKKLVLKVFIIILLLILVKEAVQAQTGSIRGRVFNEKNNEPLPFTNLIIDGTNIGSTSDLDGNFLFTGLQPGFVRLRVSAVGFEDKVTEEFMVTNARTANIDIAMRERQTELEEVVIEASQFQRREESPVSLRRLGISEIERSPGSNRDISKVIQSLPGVAFTPAFRNDVIIRGGGPNENRFFLDGVEIPNLNHFATQGASGGPVGIINVDFIREVEMYSSAFPANRGNALSSIFEFRQVRGDSERFNFRGTVGASDLALTLDGPLSENTTMIFSARRSYLQFIFGVIGLPFLPTYNDFQFKTDTRLNDRSELTLIGIGALDQFRLNLDANETEDQRFILDFLPVSEQWNYTMGAVYRRFRDNGFDRFVVSRNMLRNFSYKHLENDESKRRTFDYESDEIENKFRYERTSQLGAWRLMAGGGGEYAKYLNDTYREIFFNNEPSVIEYDSFLELYKWSLFGQVTRGFYNDRLTFSFGLRTDANNYSSNMANPLNQLSPRISGSYQLRENLSVSASTGRFFQLPSYTTLGFRDNGGVLRNKENNLKFISVDHYVTGFEYLPTRQTQITLEGFYKNYRNYPFSVIDSVAIGSKSTDFGIFGDEEVTSTSRGRSYGAELLYREQRFKGLNIILSYTFVRSEFDDIRSGDFIPSAWDSRHIVNLTASKKLPRNWDIGAKWRFSGGAPYTPFDLELSQRVEAWDAQRLGYLDYRRFNSNRLPAFHQLDLRIDKQYFFNNFSLMFYLDIQNVYNFQSELPPNLLRETDETGNPLPAEDGRYQLKELRNTTGTILPSIGIMFEF